MLVIRQQQLDVFADEMRQRFLSRLSDYLLQEYPDRAGVDSTGKWHRKLAKAVSEAEHFGIEIENDVARFVELKFMNDWDFPDNEAGIQVLDILRNEKLDGTSKIDAVVASLEQADPIETANNPEAIS